MKIKIKKIPMLASMKKRLAPPVFEGDEEKTRRASFLNLTILVFLSFLGLLILGSLFVGVLRTGIGFTLSVLFSVVLLLYYLLHHGKVALAGSGLMILVFVAIIIVEIINGTVRVPATLVYLFVIITAGILFEWRGTLLSFCICSLAVLGLILAENANILPQPVHIIPLANWITYTGLFGVIGAVSLWGQQTTQQALGRAEQEIEARKQVEAALVETALEREAALEKVSKYKVELEAQNEEKAKRAAELLIANQELVFQNEEKAKRAAELLIANQELTFQNDEKEKRAAELDLVNSYLENLINYANAPIIVWDPQFCITRFNHAFEFLTGRTEAEVLGQSLEILFPPALAENSMARIRKTSIGERWESVEINILHRDASVRTVLWNSATLFEPDGKTTLATIAQGQDITVRKRIENQLQITEKRLSTLAEYSRALTWEVEAEGLYNYISPTCLSMLGYSPEEIVGTKHFYDLHPDEGRAAFKAAAFEFFDRQLPFRNLENMLQTRDGRVIWVSTNGLPILDENGKLTGYRGVDTDISERKRAELALAQTSARLSLAVRAGGVGTWEYDIVNDRMIWDDQMYCLYGITSQDFSGAYDAWQKGLHPQDRERGDNEIQAAQRGEKEYDTEFRVVWPDGSVHNIRALALVQRDQAGKPLSMLGTNWDITINKQAQEQIAELGLSNQTLLNTVTDGIHVLNDQGKLMDANPAFSKMLGYTQEELKLLNVTDWDVQWTPDELAIKVIELIDHPAMIETRHRRKDDVILDVEINAVGVTIHGRNYLYASARNISARKASEEKIRLLNVELENLALTDFLTNLFNRRYFMLRGTEAVKRTLRNKEPMALLMMDIDWFKKVNDNYGHEVGDLALQHVAEVLKSSLREIDILARVGGEEFAVLLPNTGHDDAVSLAERVRKLIQDTPFETGGEAITITISLGAAVFEKGMSDIDDLLRSADAALYEAKRSGRNCVRVFQDKIGGLCVLR